MKEKWSTKGCKKESSVSYWAFVSCVVLTFVSGFFLGENGIAPLFLIMGLGFLINKRYWDLKYCILRGQLK